LSHKGASYSSTLETLREFRGCASFASGLLPKF
jgi:hypothetical protein